MTVGTAESNIYDVKIEETSMEDGQGRFALTVAVGAQVVCPRTTKVISSASSGSRQMPGGRATAAGLATAAQDFRQEDDITVLTVARLVPAV